MRAESNSTQQEKSTDSLSGDRSTSSRLHGVLLAASGFQQRPISTQGVRLMSAFTPVRTVVTTFFQCGCMIIVDASGKAPTQQICCNAHSPYELLDAARSIAGEKAKAANLENRTETTREPMTANTTNGQPERGAAESRPLGRHVLAWNRRLAGVLISKSSTKVLISLANWRSARFYCAVFL